MADKQKLQNTKSINKNLYKNNQQEDKLGGKESNLKLHQKKSKKI